MVNLIASIRRALARFIAPRDYLFNPDMSRELDRRIVEVESLREELGRLTK
jgi:hypothetical protein